MGTALAETAGAAGVASLDGAAPSTSSQHNLAVLNAISVALNRSPDVRGALTRALGLVAELLGMQSGWIWLLDAETERFYVAADLNLPPYLQTPIQMTGEEACSCIWEFRAGTLTAKNVDVLECSRLRRAARHAPDAANAAAQTGGLRYHASIPLLFGEKPLGILNLTGPAWREHTGGELELLATIAYQIGIAIERARLAEESARLARAEGRARLAREIHDTLAQGLTAIGLHLESALRHVGSDPTRVRERLERALTTTRENLEEARRSVQDLRAAPLAGRSLVDALAALARTLTTETGIRAPLTVTDPHDTLTHLPLRTEAELYRIAQEALTNVRKHAQATTVSLSLTATKTRLTLTIQDNGTGFPPQNPTPAECQGLQGIQERTKLLSGRLTINSAPTKGTTVSVSLPSAGPGERSVPGQRSYAPPMITLALIDDHPIVRDGLIAVLSDEPDFQVLFASPSAEEATHLLRNHQPHVTLLDLELPGASGIEALPTLLRAAPHTKVVLFTAYDTEERALGALRTGAKGYLLKGATSEEIDRAIRTVHAGSTHLSPRIATTVVAQFGPSVGDRSHPAAHGPTTQLTPREREVLRLVANGRSNKEIARTLSITERTAKFHVTSLLNKLGAENRARAAALGVQRGLL